MTVLEQLGALILFLGVVSVAQLILLPLAKIEIKRRASRSHIPQPGEIWVQDTEALYVVAVGPSGVELRSVGAVWQDTWDDWTTRLKRRSVYWTGTTQATASVTN
jgi:hypothetical protein